MTGWFLIFFFQLLSVNTQTGADSIVRVSVAAVITRAGENKSLPIYIFVKKGFHIQANSTDEFLIPTTLEIDGGDVLSVGKQKYPAPKKFRLEGTDNYMPVYDGSFKVIVQCRIKEGVQKGRYTLQARLRYQACDHKTCFFPKTMIFTIEVIVK